MDLKKELRKVNDRITGIAKMIDKLMTAVKEPEKEKPQAAKVKVIKIPVAQKSAPQKPVVKKTQSPKALPKKPSEKKIVAQKTIGKIQPQATAVETVFELIKNAENGMSTGLLIEKTGFNVKKVQNLVFKLRKQGKIKSVTKGMYVSA